MGKGSEVRKETKDGETGEKRVNKLVQKQKVHLTLSQVEARINELESQLEMVKSEELPINKRARKRKQILANLIRLRRAQHNPEEYLKDPELEREKREKKRQKRYEKIKQAKAELQRQKKAQRVVCLYCKKRGHSKHECENYEGREDKSICYNCGSKDHRLKDCPSEVKTMANLQFAKCFKCGERGHISAYCKLNKKGIYPKGGSCYRCGSKMHVVHDCPRNLEKKKKKKKE